MIALLKLFRRPTPAEYMARELADAELELLRAHTAQEYAQSVIDYNVARIARLRLCLQSS